MGVCWVTLFKASIRLSVSKCGGLKCLPPPPPMMWAIFVGSFRLMPWDLKCLYPFVDIESFDWGSKYLPPCVGAWLFNWGLKCLPTYVGVW